MPELTRAEVEPINDRMAERPWKLHREQRKVIIKTFTPQTGVMPTCTIEANKENLRHIRKAATAKKWATDTYPTNQTAKDFSDTNIML
ncbi:hypothetical protein N0V90_000598 [Kalmusia sp. IMI 367209]|nr:hypothetical protein N0V90_000598 [Kalmusia sp. IMI 367209]